MLHSRLLPGLTLSAVIACLAVYIGGAGALQSHGISALTVAIVLGLVVGNSFYGRIAERSASGVAFSKQTILRAGVILYGLRLTLHDVGQVGLAGVTIDALVILSTFLLSYALGTRLFGLDRTTSILIGAGSAICGAAAVMATEPVVRAKPEQVAMAVSTVVLFGTMAIFLYPILYGLNLHWWLLPSSPNAFGIYAGSTIHEVAQVFAAGRSVSSDTANTAVITKLVRVMMLAPFLIGLSAWLARAGAGTVTAATGAAATGAHESQAARKLPVPWFAFGFIAVVVLNSFVPLPARAVQPAIAFDTFLLAMAMAALGLTTHISAIRRAGAKPLLLGCLLFAWLIVGGASINTLVAACLR
jgi:uncharacterized integral membrane protein (TIGR00698 family)